MNLSEFKTTILNSPQSGTFNSLRINLTLPHLNYRGEFIGISSFYEFIILQLEGWASIGDGIPDIFKSSRNFFADQRKNIIDYVNRYISGEPDSIKNALYNIQARINENLRSVFLYNHPKVEFLIRIHSVNKEYFRGAFDYLIVIDNSEKNLFTGKLLAYEFDFKDSEITERRKAEKSTLSKLRNDFEKYLSQSETHTINYLKDYKDKLDLSLEEFRELKDTRETEVDNWFDLIKEENNTFYKNASEKLINLENTYKVKLKLEEPALYWAERARKLRNYGKISAILLFIFIGLAALSLGEILWMSPENIYSSWFDGDKSAAIRWSIVYITLLSLIFLGIRALTKYMFSCFHLASDAEERYTLTYFYLSLLKDDKVNEHDRQLIMQSLFSRADTGLLKEDSSPSMPNDFTKLIGKPN